MTRVLTCMVIVAAALSVTGNAWAQAYPSRRITIVIPNLPGSPYDPVVRAVNNEMTKRMGQSFVLEYKPGAGQTIGAKYVVNAKPDGYTLYYGSVAGLHPLFVRTNSVDASKELTAISSYAWYPYLIQARGQFKSLQELLAYSKANANQVKIGNTTGSNALLLTLVMQKTGLAGEFIRYKGLPQLITALLSGEIDWGIGTPGTAAPLVRAGKVQGMFVTASKRTALLPEVPSADELGFPDLVDLGVIQGLWGPAGLPRDIVQKLSSEAILALKKPEIIEQIRTLGGAEPLGTTPEEQLRAFDAYNKKMAEVIKLINWEPE